MSATLSLAATFGTLGSRSRGGWGSLFMEANGLQPVSGSALRTYCRSLKECLEGDWASALAFDDKGPWVWTSREPRANWAEMMKHVATLRRDVRSALKLDTDLRPALGFAGQGRMPSPLRWKVVQQQGGLGLRVFAMPHGLPTGSGRRLDHQQLVRAWTIVANKLDEHLDRTREPSP